MDDAVAALGNHRRDVILEAVAAAASELLRSSDLRQSFDKVLACIGAATGVDRVHIFEMAPVNGRDGAIDGHVVNHHLWSAPGIETPDKFRKATAPLSTVGLRAWGPRLARGETIVGNAQDFDSDARRFLESGGVKSVLSVPVFADNHWWGTIGFDDCRSERTWLPSEIDIIRTLAELVGAAVARMRQMRILADATRIIENSSTILFRFAPQPPFPLVYLSQNVGRYGYSAETMLATPTQWRSMIEPDDIRPVMDVIKSVADGRSDYARTEFRLKKPDGNIVWFDASGSAVRDHEHNLVAIEGIAFDVTERKIAAEQMAKLARTDLLTGLPNRAAFLERLNLAFAQAKRASRAFAVLYLDLDHFKDINDTRGHTVGDALLQAVGRRLAGCVRESDMVARFGGDEFAVLLDDVAGPLDVETVASKIGEAIATPFQFDGNQIHTTASIGIVLRQDGIDGPQAIMMKADLALYRAKDEGRNRFHWHGVDLDREVRERVAVGEDLRGALDRQEFELYYQPQIELASKRIVGLEALIRWHHPTRGLLLPGAFIPVAEANGTITAIGRWVLEETCRQIAAWREQGIRPPVVAVNLSAVQFRQSPDLDKMIAASLAKFGIGRGQIELELTESVLMETSQKYSDAVERLRRIGVRFAIDDFGTGYSSLAYLKSFHVSRLKIDRRFIEDVTTNGDDAAIVRATIRLAQELGTEAVAEGVETAAQRDFLVAAGCRLAQGNYFGEPMPAEALGELLADETLGGQLLPDKPLTEKAR